MLAEADFLWSLPRFGELIRTWDGVRRELRFIARTLARLQYRHHTYSILCSSRDVISSSVLPLVADSAAVSSVGTLKSLLLPPICTTGFDDVESQASTPTTSPCKDESGLHFPFTTQRELDSPVQPFPPLARWSQDDMMPVTVDDRMPASFSVPKPYMRRISQSATEGLHLPAVPAAQFYDFAQYLKTGRVLQYSHQQVSHVVEAQARQLIEAIRLSVTLACAEYQNAAITEFYELARFLEWPEDLVSAVYSATKSEPDSPARRLMVAVVAAKTCGAGKRRIRHGPRDQNIERGDRIRGKTFWRAYDEHCEAHSQECSYPSRVDEFLQ